MSDDESCYLPNPCDCSQCRWWGENGWDVSRTQIGKCLKTVRMTND